MPDNNDMKRNMDNAARSAADATRAGGEAVREGTDRAAEQTRETMERTGDQMRQGMDQATQQTQAGMNRAAEQMRDVGARMQETTGQMTQQGSQLGVKVLEQAEANTAEAFKAMRRAAEAKDLAEVMRIQGDYMRDQGSRSMTQAREIGEMIAEFGRMTMGQMTGRR